MVRSRDNQTFVESGISPPDDKRSDDKRAAGFIPAVCIRSFIHYSFKRGVPHNQLYIHNNTCPYVNGDSGRGRGPVWFPGVPDSAG